MELELDEILPWLLLAVFWIVVLTMLARRGVRWTGIFAPHAEMDGDVRRLRDEVDRLSAQVERLTEEQSFMVRLLSETDRRLLEECHRDTEPS